MRLVRYRNKQEHYGALMKDRVVCLPALAKHLSEKFPKQLEDFITLGTEGIEKAEKLIKNANENDVRNISSKLSEITLLAPIASPPKIVCLGLNYRDMPQNKTPPYQTNL